ncbi:MAG: diguanylate cyclase [Desulfuromonadaceae bacterium]|nr:diguanylate cyclase [Desulfuromonadaceae bacterium]MDD5105715.1 diguanylate cyclase [Desulfuromonadaceae bacterium]
MSVPVATATTKLKRIREAYVKQLPTQLEVIRKSYYDTEQQSCGIAELEIFHRNIHTLKGACASFGLKAVSVIAASGELLAKEAMNPETPPDKIWYQKIQECLASLEEEIKNINLSQSIDTRLVELVAATETTGERAQKVIYIFEEDSYQRMSLATQIECFGYLVTSFGQLELVCNAVQNSPPDAIIMNMILPDPSKESAGIIKAVRKDGSNVPVVFMSSQNGFRNRLAAVRAGSDAYFVKPVNVAELCSTLDTLTNTVTLDPCRILIVDDDPNLSELYSTILQSAGMTTVTVNDPLQIMSPLVEFNPDLVLTDMYMPGCNGMELAKTIRQMGASSSIPIIFLSSETDVGKQFQAMRMGGDEFLTKPISPENLIAAVAGRAGRMKIVRSYMVRDSMTGLFNYSTTKEYLENVITQAQSQKKDVSFAMIDVDTLKSINDDYGNKMGDQILITLSRLLQQCLGKSGIVGRYGGDEFAVILPDCNKKKAVQIIDQLRESFAAMRFTVNDNIFSPSFSCGVASLSLYEDAESVCKAAESALYTAKESGRNQVCEATT